MHGNYTKNITMDFDPETRNLTIEYYEDGQDGFTIVEKVGGVKIPKTIDELKVRTASTLYENIRKFWDEKYEMPEGIQMTARLTGLQELRNEKIRGTYPRFSKVGIFSDENPKCLYYSPTGELTGSSFSMVEIETPYSLPDSNVQIYDSKDKRSVGKTLLAYFTIEGFYHIFYNLAHHQTIKDIYGDGQGKDYMFEKYISDILDKDEVKELEKQFNTDNLFNYVNGIDKEEEEMEFIHTLIEKRAEHLFLL